MSILYNFIKEKSINELKSQGHQMTGKLISSFRKESIKTSDGYRLRIFVEDYGISLNAPYLRKVGKNGSHSGYVAGILRFAEHRGLDKSTAWKIIRAQQKGESHPMPGSFKYSKNGRRIRWIENSVNESRDFEIGSDFIELKSGLKAGEVFPALISSFRRGMAKYFS